MKKKLRVLYLSTEISPFSAESTLSELSFHLTRYCRTKGHDVRVVTPKFNFIKERRYNLREVIRLREIPVPLAGKLEMVAVKSGFIPETKVQVYFLEQEKYFARDGITRDPATGNFYPDMDEMFITFTRAVVEMLKILSWQPQIIHVTDWTSALAAYYVNKTYAQDDFYQQSNVVLSLVDYKNAGYFPKSSVFKASIDPDTFKPGCDIELKGKFSFLKSGIVHADKIVINGDKCLNEFDAAFKAWFKDYIKSRQDDTLRIPFGIDYEIWNPNKDEKISANYSHRDPSAKVENKKMLIDKYDLKMKPDAPLVGCVWDNGDFAELQDAVEIISKSGGAMVIADKSAREEAINEFVNTKPGKIGAVKLLTSLTIKQLVAGADMMILAPRKYEDLLHYKAARYGAIPVVPNCGYFPDDVSKEDDMLPGFLYKKGDAKSLAEVVKKAMDCFRDEKDWIKMVKKAMKFDSSWNRAARAYLELYNQIT